MINYTLIVFKIPVCCYSLIFFSMLCFLMESLFFVPVLFISILMQGFRESADRHVKVTNWCAPPSLRSYLVCHERCVQHSIKTNPQFSLNVNYLEGMLNAFPNRNRVNSVPTRRIFSRCGKCLFWANNEINLKYLPEVVITI